MSKTLLAAASVSALLLVSVPLAASSPKMETSFGALGAHLRVFDPQSQVSMFGAIFEYTLTARRDGARRRQPASAGATAGHPWVSPGARMRSRS